MDKYMNLDEDQDAELDQRAIRLKDCPRCRTPIRRNLRYGTHINRSLAAIEMVKEKINGVPDVIKQKAKVLRLQLHTNQNLKKHFPDQFAFLKEKLKTKDLSHQQLWHLENLMTYLEIVGKLKAMKEEHMSLLLDKVSPFSNKVEEVLRFLLDPAQRFSDQQIADLERELKRLSYLAELNVRCGMSPARSAIYGTEVQQLREILEDIVPFSEGLDCTVKQMFTYLDTKLPRSGLGITDDERVMILKAIGLNKGHWYKCPNGHVYAIGECGGASQESKCPECDAAIGGSNHNLIQGNAVATEMDGAEHAAWSEAANLANFDMQNMEE